MFFVVIIGFIIVLVILIGLENKDNNRPLDHIKKVEKKQSCGRRKR